MDVLTRWDDVKAKWPLPSFDEDPPGDGGEHNQAAVGDDAPLSPLRGPEGANEGGQPSTFPTADGSTTVQHPNPLLHYSSLVVEPTISVDSSATAFTSRQRGGVNNTNFATAGSSHNNNTIAGRSRSAMNPPTHPPSSAASSMRNLSSVAYFGASFRRRSTAAPESTSGRSSAMYYCSALELSIREDLEAYFAQLQAELDEAANAAAVSAQSADAQRGNSNTTAAGVVAAKMRSLVSLNKIRFQMDGFDLDLTYITPRIIAMGFPSSGRESYYRNPVDEVERFFNKRHAGRYMIYNLCSERTYDTPNRFGGRFKRFPFDDHNAPKNAALIGDFVRDAQTFLSKDEDNVVAVHCKAGKGRTGLMVSCLLMSYIPGLRQADAALSFFADARTNDGEGVTIPSQQRYVKYWDMMLREFDGKEPQPPRVVLLQRLVVYSLAFKPLALEPGDHGGIYLTISVGTPDGSKGLVEIFDSRKPVLSAAVTRRSTNGSRSAAETQHNTSAPPPASSSSSGVQFVQVSVGPNGCPVGNAATFVSFDFGSWFHPSHLPADAVLRPAAPPVGSSAAVVGAGGPVVGAGPLSGDIRIDVFHKKSMFGDAGLFHFWLNTSMCSYPQEVLPKSELDKACKDRKNSELPEGLRVECTFISAAAVATIVASNQAAGATQKGLRSSFANARKSLVATFAGGSVTAQPAATTATVTASAAPSRRTAGEEGGGNTTVFAAASDSPLPSVATAVRPSAAIATGDGTATAAATGGGASPPSAPQPTSATKGASVAPAPAANSDSRNGFFSRLFK